MKKGLRHYMSEFRVTLPVLLDQSRPNLTPLQRAFFLEAIPSAFEKYLAPRWNGPERRDTILQLHAFFYLPPPADPPGGPVRRDRDAED